MGSCVRYLMVFAKNGLWPTPPLSLLQVSCMHRIIVCRQQGELASLVQFDSSVVCTEVNKATEQVYSYWCKVRRYRVSFVCVCTCGRATTSVAAWNLGVPCDQACSWVPTASPCLGLEINLLLCTAKCWLGIWAGNLYIALLDHTGYSTFREPSPCDILWAQAQS